jgi:arylsulfatase A-like enzyme
MTKRPPNILLLWTDEQRADTLAAYGNRSGIMPCLDRFAREATVFDHAYCASPVCTPSRGSIMTGVFPHHHGAEMNNVPMRAEARSLAEYLPEYETGYIGKWHLGDEIFGLRGQP